MRMKMAALALCLLFGFTTVAAPATADAPRRYGQLEHGLGEIYPTQQPELPAMGLENFLAIGIGVAVGAALMQTVLDGSMAMIAGALLGGLIGDWWFKEKLWPFEPETGLRL